MGVISQLRLLRSGSASFTFPIPLAEQDLEETAERQHSHVEEASCIGHLSNGDINFCCVGALKLWGFFLL